MKTSEGGPDLRWIQNFDPKTFRQNDSGVEMKKKSSGCQGSENALLLQDLYVNITNPTLVKQEGFAFLLETPSVSSWKLSCFSSVRSRIDEHASGAGVTAPGGAALRGPDAALGVMKGHCPLSVSPLRLLGAGSRSWKAPYNRANEPTWTQGTNCCAPPSQGQTLNCSETIKVTRSRATLEKGESVFFNSHLKKFNRGLIN